MNADLAAGVIIGVLAAGVLLTLAILRLIDLLAGRRLKAAALDKGESHARFSEALGAGREQRRPDAVAVRRELIRAGDAAMVELKRAARHEAQS